MKNNINLDPIYSYPKPSFWKRHFYDILFTLILWPFASHLTFRVYDELFYQKDLSKTIDSLVAMLLQPSSDQTANNAFIISFLISVFCLTLLILSQFKFKNTRINIEIILYIISWVLACFSNKFNLSKSHIIVSTLIIIIQLISFFGSALLLSYIVQENIIELISPEKNVESKSEVIRTIGILIFGIALLKF